MTEVFDTYLAPRTECEWRSLLRDLVALFGEFSGINFVATTWYVSDDTPGHSCYSNCVDIRGPINRSLDLEACGALCISGTVGENVFVSADLLLFSAGRRIVGPEENDVIYLPYDRQSGWQAGRWMRDGEGEWEMHRDNQRWCVTAS